MLDALQSQDTICAISTPSGSGGIAVIRVSGSKSMEAVGNIFRGKEELCKAKHKSLIYGSIYDGEERIDDVVLGIFYSPHSYTGEDVIEISCHGSIFIQKRIIQILFDQGVRLAKAGEFSLRAYMNGKMDLLQAEAVADIIQADSRRSHKIAMQQMRGGYSAMIKELRNELINFSSLIELELDFSEEDVEFADRTQLKTLLEKIQKTVEHLINSYALGNVIKNGVKVVIAGKPNVGKSSLLNAILKEDKAIVSAIPGTTRDVVEDSIVLEGIRFRFSDTAGIREADNEIESIGIERAFEKISKADIVVYLYENKDRESIQGILDELKKKYPQVHFIGVLNKVDTLHKNELSSIPKKHLCISAKEEIGIPSLIKQFIAFVEDKNIESEIIVSNERHLQALEKSQEFLKSIHTALGNGVPTDLLSIDIRHALHHLGTITGQISVEDVLGQIFSSFCIGK